MSKAKAGSDPSADKLPRLSLRSSRGYRLFAYGFTALGVVTLPDGCKIVTPLD